MCLTGFLAELLCCVAESVEKFEQDDTVAEEIQQSGSVVGDLKKRSSINTEVSNHNNNNRQSTQTCLKSILVKEVVGVAIQANPSVGAIKNTLGAIHDYQNGEAVSDIVKERAIQMIKDQIPAVPLKYAEAEIKNGMEHVAN